MEGPVRIAVTSRSLFDGGAETLHFSGAGTLRPTAAGWDLPNTPSPPAGENGAALSSRIRLTAEPRRAILWTLGPEGYGLPLDPEHETQARLSLGLTVAVRTRAVEFLLEEPDRGYIPPAYTLLDRGLPLSRMQLEIRMTKETI